MQTAISVIVPIYNEENVLCDNVKYFMGVSQEAELIFIDGGSIDKSVEAASHYGIVLSGTKGRAAQMNQGAQQAHNDILLFLHADNIINLKTLLNIKNKMHENDFVGGCLTQKIDNKQLIFRFIEAQGNIRARLTREFYGDQGIFVRKDVFSHLGGFPRIPIFEDVLFTRKLRCAGKTIVLPDKIMVSARRWEKNGIIKTTLLFNLIIILFRLNVPLHKIKQLYKDIR